MQLPDSVQNILAYGQGYNDGMKDGNICGFHDALVCAVHDLTGLLKKYHDMKKEYAGLQAKAYRERMGNKPQLESATENHARWIPCSERLPEDNCYTLVAVLFDEIYEVYIAAFMGDGWHTVEGYVTHWMPLPEPPEGGAEDENKG